MSEWASFFVCNPFCGLDKKLLFQSLFRPFYAIFAAVPHDAGRFLTN